MFEYHDNKSRANKERHGIDFLEAQKIWDDPFLIEVQARTEDERRYLIIGKIDKIFWSAVITYRKSNIRIISARRSRKEEIKIYESC